MILDNNLPKANVLIGELNQVWTNIIDNAVDAMDKEGTLHIRSYVDRNKICVEITDNGSGIPEDIQNRIWEPFYTTKGVGEGTGLGLALVFSIMDDMNGKVQLTSPVKEQGNPGTRFTLQLPSAQYGEDFDLS